MVAFGTLTNKETSLAALRTRFMAVKSFGSFDVDQAYEPANQALSINHVDNSLDDFDEYLLRERESAAKGRGQVRTEQMENELQTKAAVLAAIGDNAVCPMDNCTTVLVSKGRIFHKGLGMWICIQCNARDGKPRQKVKRIKPDVCETAWCKRTDKISFA